MKKIVFSLAFIALVLAVTVGATRAFFSDTEISSGNTFSAGTLAISLTTPNGALPYSFTNMAPGQVQTVLYNVNNTGSLPVHLRALTSGTWGDLALSDTLMKVTSIEIDEGAGAGFSTLITNQNGITGPVCYSNDGTCAGTLRTLASGATLKFRLTNSFDSSAGNAYQGRTYTASTTIDAKQTENPSF